MPSTRPDADIARVGGAPDAEALARRGYDVHGGELYRFALTRLGDDALAQDAVQETIVRAWKSGHRFDPTRGSLRTWLFAIHRNVVIDQLTARRWNTSMLDRPFRDRPFSDREDELISENSVADPADSVANDDAVVHALALLSNDHRTAIVETYLRDRPYAEVATELGVPVATLRSRVYHGLRRLRSALSPEEV